MTRETRVIAVVLALSAFIVGVLSGMLSGAPVVSTLTQALIAMAACYVVGLCIGGVISHVIGEHNAQYRAANPVPETLSPIDAAPTIEPGSPAHSAAPSGRIT